MRYVISIFVIEFSILLKLKLSFLQNLNKWVEGKHEVEIVDMILKLQQKLKICNENFDQSNPTTSTNNRNNTKEQLLKHLDDMKNLLPDDLKTILSNT